MDLLPVKIVEAILTQHLKDYDPAMNKVFSVWIILVASICHCWHSILVMRRANQPFACPKDALVFMGIQKSLGTLLQVD